MSNRGKPLPYLHDVVLPYRGQDCLIWPFFRDADGRGKMQYNGSVQLVSRIVCELVNGPPPSAFHAAAHECGKSHLGCIAPTHLTWKTYKENEADKIRHGTKNWGSINGMSKLTEQDVKRIRALKGALSKHQIAEQFGVSPHTIYEIQTGRKWSWLDA